MLEVIQFDNGWYGLRNTWTGVVLVKSDGTPRYFKSTKKAWKKATKLEDRLAKTIRMLPIRSPR